MEPVSAWALRGVHINLRTFKAVSIYIINDALEYAAKIKIHMSCI